MNGNAGNPLCNAHTCVCGHTRMVYGGKYKNQFHINLTALVLEYFPFCLLSENIKIKIYKTIILSVPRSRMTELYCHSPMSSWHSA
jgi:hypothetical protein